MTKKHFIELADVIKHHNRFETVKFTEEHLNTLICFCRSQNYAFKPERWKSYIKGECGPNGGAVKV